MRKSPAIKAEAMLPDSISEFSATYRMVQDLMNKVYPPGSIVMTRGGSSFGVVHDWLNVGPGIYLLVQVTEDVDIVIRGNTAVWRPCNLPRDEIPQKILTARKNFLKRNRSIEKSLGTGKS